MVEASIFLATQRMERSQAIHALRDCLEAMYMYIGDSKEPNGKKTQVGP